MILSTKEFTAAGFTISPENQTLTENCIKRAERILNAMCRGRLASAAAQSAGAAELIKTAVAFEADALIKAELSRGGSERVSIGDVSYSETTERESPPDVSQTVRNLMRAAGCFYGLAAAEVTE